MTTKKDVVECVRTFEQLSKYGNKEMYGVNGLMDRILKLSSYEKTLHRYAEIYCNREMHPDEVKREVACQKRVVAVAKELGLKADFNGDPRGACIKLLLPDGIYNNMDGESWRIFF